MKMMPFFVACFIGLCSVSMTQAQTIVNYSLELLPGSKFTGYRYILSGNNIVFNPKTEVPWLSLENNAVATATCALPHVLEFHFMAPQQPGVYSVQILSSNNGITYNVQLSVTSTPRADTTRLILTQVSSSNGISYEFPHAYPSDHECLRSFLPTKVKGIQFEAHPQVSWLKANKWIDTLAVSELTTTFQFEVNRKDFSQPGKYYTLLHFKQQWASLPNYRYLEIDVRGFMTSSNDQAAEAKTNFKLYPNPVQDLLYIETQSSYALAQIYLSDMTGRRQMLPFIKQAAQQLAVDVAGFAAGAYVLMLVDEQGAVESRKLIIAR